MIPSSLALRCQWFLHSDFSFLWWVFCKNKAGKLPPPRWWCHWCISYSSEQHWDFLCLWISEKIWYFFGAIVMKIVMKKQRIRLISFLYSLIYTLLSKYCSQGDMDRWKYKDNEEIFFESSLLKQHKLHSEARFTIAVPSAKIKNWGIYKTIVSHKQSGLVVLFHTS